MIKCEMLLCKSNSYSNSVFTKITSVTARVLKNSKTNKKQYPSILIKEADIKKEIQTKNTVSK